MANCKVMLTLKGGYFLQSVSNEPDPYISSVYELKKSLYVNTLFNFLYLPLVTLNTPDSIEYSLQVYDLSLNLLNCSLTYILVVNLLLFFRPFITGIRQIKNTTTYRCKTPIDFYTIDLLSGPERFNGCYRFANQLATRYCSVKVKFFNLTPMFSLTNLFRAFDWLEREVWDMMGLFFIGNNDMRRLLSDYGFYGHPLRKDFPLSGFTEVCFSSFDGRVASAPIFFYQEMRQLVVTLKSWLGEYGRNIQTSLSKYNFMLSLSSLTNFNFISSVNNFLTYVNANLEFFAMSTLVLVSTSLLLAFALKIEYDEDYCEKITKRMVEILGWLAVGSDFFIPRKDVKDVDAMIIELDRRAKVREEEARNKIRIKANIAKLRDSYEGATTKSLTYYKQTPEEEEDHYESLPESYKQSDWEEIIKLDISPITAPDDFDEEEGGEVPIIDDYAQYFAFEEKPELENYEEINYLNRLKGNEKLQDTFVKNYPKDKTVVDEILRKKKINSEFAKDLDVENLTKVKDSLQPSTLKDLGDGDLVARFQPGSNLFKGDEETPSNRLPLANLKKDFFREIMKNEPDMVDPSKPYDGRHLHYRNELGSEIPGALGLEALVKNLPEGSSEDGLETFGAQIYARMLEVYDNDPLFVLNETLEDFFSQVLNRQRRDGLSGVRSSKTNSIKNYYSAIEIAKRLRTRGKGYINKPYSKPGYEELAFLRYSQDVFDERSRDYHPRDWKHLKKFHASKIKKHFGEKFYKKFNKSVNSFTALQKLTMWPRWSKRSNFAAERSWLESVETARDESKFRFFRFVQSLRSGRILFITATEKKVYGPILNKLRGVDIRVVNDPELVAWVLVKRNQGYIRAIMPQYAKEPFKKLDRNKFLANIKDYHEAWEVRHSLFEARKKLRYDYFSNEGLEAELKIFLRETKKVKKFIDFEEKNFLKIFFKATEKIRFKNVEVDIALKNIFKKFVTWKKFTNLRRRYMDEDDRQRVIRRGIITVVRKSNVFWPYHGKPFGNSNLRGYVEKGKDGVFDFNSFLLPYYRGGKHYESWLETLPKVKIKKCEYYSGRPSKDDDERPEWVREREDNLISKALDSGEGIVDPSPTWQEVGGDKTRFWNIESEESFTDHLFDYEAEDDFPLEIYDSFWTVWDFVWNQIKKVEGQSKKLKYTNLKREDGRCYHENHPKEIKAKEYMYDPHYATDNLNKFLSLHPDDEEMLLELYEFLVEHHKAMAWTYYAETLDPKEIPNKSLKHYFRFVRYDATHHEVSKYINQRLDNRSPQRESKRFNKAFKSDGAETAFRKLTENDPSTTPTARVILLKYIRWLREVEAVAKQDVANYLENEFKGAPKSSVEFREFKELLEELPFEFYNRVGAETTILNGLIPPLGVGKEPVQLRPMDPEIWRDEIELLTERSFSEFKVDDFNVSQGFKNSINWILVSDSNFARRYRWHVNVLSPVAWTFIPLQLKYERPSEYEVPHLSKILKLKNSKYLKREALKEWKDWEYRKWDMVGGVGYGKLRDVKKYGRDKYDMDTLKWRSDAVLLPPDYDETTEDPVRIAWNHYSFHIDQIRKGPMFRTGVAQVMVQSDIDKTKFAWVYVHVTEYSEDTQIGQPNVIEIKICNDFGGRTLFEFPEKDKFTIQFIVNFPLRFNTLILDNMPLVKIGNGYVISYDYVPENKASRTTSWWHTGSTNEIGRCFKFTLIKVNNLDEAYEVIPKGTYYWSEKKVAMETITWRANIYKIRDTLVKIRDIFRDIQCSIHYKFGWSGIRLPKRKVYNPVKKQYDNFEENTKNTKQSSTASKSEGQ